MKPSKNLNTNDNRSEIDSDEDIVFLKQTPYNKFTKQDIRERLIRTAEKRRTILEDKNTKMMSYFPYLFVHPELVITFDLFTQTRCNHSRYN